MSSLDQWLEHAPKPADLADGKKWHVFLSYRSVNRAWVLHLYDVLRELGYEVFMDQYVLAAGASLVRELETHLEKSAAGVLVWSTDAADSDWCREEYESFHLLEQENDSFRYVIAKLDEENLPLFARKSIWVDFSLFRGGPTGAGLLRLLYGLRGEALPPAAVAFAAEVDEETRAAGARIEAAVSAGMAGQLVALEERGGLAWRTGAALGCLVAEGLVKLKGHDEALALLAKLEGRFPKSLRVRQLKGLALARSGDWQSAQLELEELRAMGEQDPETLGILARTWMDRYQESKDLNHLRRSRDLYVRAFENDPSDYYTGINAAAKSVFLDEPDTAARYATEVQEIVGTEKKEGDYWLTATIAEVQLIRRRYDRAGEIYGDAVAMAPEERGSHDSSWGQARRLLAHLGASDEEAAQVKKAFAHLEA